MIDKVEAGVFMIYFVVFCIGSLFGYFMAHKDESSKDESSNERDLRNQLRSINYSFENLGKREKAAVSQIVDLEIKIKKDAEYTKRLEDWLKEANEKVKNSKSQNDLDYAKIHSLTAQLFEANAMLKQKEEYIEAFEKNKKHLDSFVDDCDEEGFYIRCRVEDEDEELPADSSVHDLPWIGYSKSDAGD